MAFNLLAIPQAPVDWSEISERYIETDRLFEIFPIAGTEIGDALGISIPSKFFNEESWGSASTFLARLAESCKLEVYDMYAGSVIDIATYTPEGLNDG